MIGYTVYIHLSDLIDVFLLNGRSFLFSHLYIEAESFGL